MTDPVITFETFLLFLREWAHISPLKEITSGTQFERDLGITGDDVSDLLQATETKFSICLASEEDGYRKTFNLGPNEYLFNPEGGMIPELTSSFSNSVVRPFTVGELYFAVEHALAAKLTQSDSITRPRFKSHSLGWPEIHNLQLQPAKIRMVVHA